MNTTLDRVRGMFIGAFLGDALGAPHEFACNSSIPYTGKLEHQAFLFTRYQGKKEIKVGQVTDDSEMTLTLLRTIINDNGYNKDNVVLAYMKWANSGGWMIGNNTRALLKGVKTIQGYNKRSINVFMSGSQSNGALMRCSPLALLYDNNAVLQDVSITNPVAVCVDCNLVYVNSLRLALQGVDPVTIFNFAKSIAQTDEVKEVLSNIENNVYRNISYNKGWCLHGLWCTFYVLTKFENYSDAMKWIIEKKGSDTDTNACIAGALLGAILGFDKIKLEQSDNINILLSVDSTLNPTSRPKEYSPYDFYELTQKAYDITLSQ